MRSLLALGFGLSLIACEPATPAVAPTAPAAPAERLAPPPPVKVGTATLEKAPDYGKVDKVGPNDGAIKPDGIEDLSFTSTIEGPIAALFLVSVSEEGLPTGQLQADTLHDNDVRPSELGMMRGGTTSSLGVFEGDKMLNAADGSLTVATSTRHQLTLYIAKALECQAGMRLRVYVLRPDKTLEAGATLVN